MRDGVASSGETVLEVFLRPDLIQKAVVRLHEGCWGPDGSVEECGDAVAGVLEPAIEEEIEEVLPHPGRGESPRVSIVDSEKKMLSDVACGEASLGFGDFRFDRTSPETEPAADPPALVRGWPRSRETGDLEKEFLERVFDFRIRCVLSPADITDGEVWELDGLSELAGADPGVDLEWKKGTGKKRTQNIYIYI